MSLWRLRRYKWTCRKWHKCTEEILNFDPSTAKTCERKCPAKDYISIVEGYRKYYEEKIKMETEKYGECLSSPYNTLRVSPLRRACRFWIWGDDLSVNINQANDPYCDICFFFKETPDAN